MTFYAPTRLKAVLGRLPPLQVGSAFSAAMQAWRRGAAESLCATALCCYELVARVSAVSRLAAGRACTRHVLRWARSHSTPTGRGLLGVHLVAQLVAVTSASPPPAHSLPAGTDPQPVPTDVPLPKMASSSNSTRRSLSQGGSRLHGSPRGPALCCCLLLWCMASGRAHHSPCRAWGLGRGSFHSMGCRVDHITERPPVRTAMERAAVSEP